jgi:hypothetical protein
MDIATLDLHQLSDLALLRAERLRLDAERRLIGAMTCAIAEIDEVQCECVDGVWRL